MPIDWNPRNESGRKGLKDWLNERLDNVVNEEFIEGFNASEGQPVSAAEMEAFLKTWRGPQALAAAKQGNMEPLQNLLWELHPELPGIDQFIRKRDRRRGEHHEKPPDPSELEVQIRRQTDGGVERVPSELRLKAAITDVRRIRNLRQKYGDGKRKGPFGTGAGAMTAEGVAAERWDLDEDEVYGKRLSRERLNREAEEKRTAEEKARARRR
jgi:hypothetical protein